MLYFFRVLLLLINIDQETILNWFGVKNLTNSNVFSQKFDNNNTVNLLTSEVEPVPGISLETLKLIAEGLWDKIQDGLTLDRKSVV